MRDSVRDFDKYTVDKMFDNVKNLIARCKESFAVNPEYYARIDLEYGD